MAGRPGLILNRKIAESPEDYDPRSGFLINERLLLRIIWRSRHQVQVRFVSLNDARDVIDRCELIEFDEVVVDGEGA